MTDIIKSTPFHAFHKNSNARIVDFAGYHLPVSFAGGIREHQHVRDGNAGLFDVSHMGQITLSHPDILKYFDPLTPSNIMDMTQGAAKYSVLTQENGGIIDDLIITKISDQSLFIVVNGSRKYTVLEHLQKHLPPSSITHHDDYGLLALQGQKSVAILNAHVPDIHHLGFMQAQKFDFKGHIVQIARCGYTGEDGFEIYIPPSATQTIYETLFQHQDVQPIGLGARDTLRLEAGLCLYGQDIDVNTSPIEANLGWLVSKNKTKAQNYIGANIIQQQLQDGVSKKRVGLLPKTKAPMRQHVKLFNAQDVEIGYITSGTFSPTLQRPIAMGYVMPEYSQVGKEIFAELRGKKIPVEIAQLPFIAHKYYR